MSPTGGRWLGIHITGLWWRSVFTFPSIVGSLHGKFSAPVILDLAPFVDQSLRSHVIQTINALALISTHDACLEALNKGRGYVRVEWARQQMRKGYTNLAVLFEAFRPFTFASHVMRTLRCCTSWTCVDSSNDSRFECIRVLGTRVLHRLVSNILVLGVISAVVAIAPVTNQFRSEAFTIQLQTF